mmetsp:Transcript_19263/g.33240  ORF Transcript_19263/g.33240 Transcript_19263/m.33240 type:complete len:216 (-) Transcript_19263:18-665(-)
MTMAPVPLRGMNRARYSISAQGIRNARVLPEPVRAAPSTSRPVKSAGIVRACTSVMQVNPIPLMPLAVGSDNDKLANSVSVMMPSTVASCRSTASPCTWSRSSRSESSPCCVCCASSSCSDVTSALSSWASGCCFFCFLAFGCSSAGAAVLMVDFFAPAAGSSWDCALGWPELSAAGSLCLGCRCLFRRRFSCSPFSIAMIAASRLMRFQPGRQG